VATSTGRLEVEGRRADQQGQTDRGARQDRRRKVWVRQQREGLVPSRAGGMSSGSQPRGRAGPDVSPRVRGERRAGQIPRSGAPASGQESPRYRDGSCIHSARTPTPTHNFWPTGPRSNQFPGLRTGVLPCGRENRPNIIHKNNSNC